MHLLVNESGQQATVVLCFPASHTASSAAGQAPCLIMRNGGGISGLVTPRSLIHPQVAFKLNLDEIETFMFDKTQTN